jgi:hypothetical protein
MADVTTVRFAEEETIKVARCKKKPVNYQTDMKPLRIGMKLCAN